MSVRFIIVVCGLLLLIGSSRAQSPSGNATAPKAADTAIIFNSPRPLIDETALQNNALMNSWGFNGFFNDFGFGFGLYYRHVFNDDFSLHSGFDFGTAKGPNELGLYGEVKINRIFVMPLMANMEYRLLQSVLGMGLRPYVTAGAGPVFVMTTDGQKDFFSALGSPVTNVTYGINFGLGAYFGSDPKTTFGASLKYYIIPYSRGVETTYGVFLNNFSGASLNVSYGFNF